MSNVLLLGCGSTRDRRIKVEGRTGWAGQQLVTVDFEARHKPDILWDLNIYPWPVASNEFSEVHAYELLEHLGRQGDLGTFFDCFGEIYRALVPDGRLCATVPRHDSIWAWGDPGHTRVINAGTLSFLDQEQYRAQVGVTAMADYRRLWKGDFEVSWGPEFTEHNMGFILRAVKPPRL